MHPIAISNDITVALTPTVSMHFHMSLQGVFSPGGFSLDFPAPMYWPPGFALGSNKFTVTVLHKGMPVVLDGHDCGAMIPHVHCMPVDPNVLTVVHVMFSSRKVNFFTSDKLADGKCIGVAKLLAWPPAPMTSCGEPVAMPGTGVPTTALNSAFVDLSWNDALIGWGTVIAMLALDLVLSTFGPAPSVLGMVMNKGGVGDRALCKQGIAMLSGAARMALTDGPASVKPKVGSPYFSAEYGMVRDKDGDVFVMAKLNAPRDSAEVGRGKGSFYFKSEERSHNDVITVEQRPGQKPDYGYQKLSTKFGSWGQPL